MATCPNRDCRSTNIRVTDPGAFRYSFICMSCRASWDKNSPLVNRMMASAALGIAFGPAGLLGALFGPDDIFS